MSFSKVLVFLIPLCLSVGEVHSAATFPPNLNVAISAPDQVESEAEIVYEVTLDNSGEASATNVSLKLRNPEQGSFVSIDDSGFSCVSFDNFAPNGTTTCKFNVIAPNSPVTITFVWRAPDTQTQLTLAASVEGDGDDESQIEDNSAEVATQVVLPPDTPVDDIGGGNDDGNGVGNADDGAEAAGDGACILNPVAGDRGTPMVVWLLLALLPGAWLVRARSAG